MAYIMNRDLFPTKKDAEIARLNFIIQKFKEYDKKRTEDYNRVYKELEWYKAEFDTITCDDKKARKIKNQGATIARLQTVISMNKYKDDYSLDDIDKYKLLKENGTFRNHLAQRVAEVKSLKEEVSKLVTELCQAKSQNNNDFH